jgi:hypothetical protein
MTTATYYTVELLMEDNKYITSVALRQAERNLLLVITELASILFFQS